MQSFTLVCACGQAMTVPESALGRTGLCPACGKEVAISRHSLQAPSPAPQRRGGGLLSRRKASEVTQSNENREEAWKKFATAVDLYNNRRYAEALALLGALEQVFPGNPHIQAAQAQCADALREASAPVLQYDGERVPEDALSEELIKGVVLKKLLHGSTEEIQLQAAELGARLLGLLPTARAGATGPVPIVIANGGAPEANGHEPRPAAEPKQAKRRRSTEEIP